MIRRCLIIDTETTGLDPKVDAVIEIGAILYDVENLTRLVCFSTIIKTNRVNEAYPINRISQAALDSFHVQLEIPDSFHSVSHPWSVVTESLAQEADVVLAHGVEFDRSFLGATWGGKSWACTRTGFRWPMQTHEGQGFVSLALAHGIGVGSAHRSLTDCMLIAELLDRMPLFGADVQAMFARAMRPKAMYRALVPIEMKDLAKSAGFDWNKPGREKMWSRVMAKDDVGALPFKTSLLWEVS